jgi:hypothetical protein
MYNNKYQKKQIYALFAVTTVLYCCVMAHSAYKMVVVVGGYSGRKWVVALPLNVSEDVPQRQGGHLSVSFCVTTS